MISARMRRCADIYMIVPRVWKGKRASRCEIGKERIVKSVPFLKYVSIRSIFIPLSCNIVIFCVCVRARVFVPSFNVPFNSFECVFSLPPQQGNLISIYICKNHYPYRAFVSCSDFKWSNLRICKYERVFPGTVTTSIVLHFHTCTFIHASIIPRRREWGVGGTIPISLIFSIRVKRKKKKKKRNWIIQWGIRETFFFDSLKKQWKARNRGGVERKRAWNERERERGHDQCYREIKKKKKRKRDWKGRKWCNKGALVWTEEEDAEDLSCLEWSWTKRRRKFRIGRDILLSQSVAEADVIAQRKMGWRVGNVQNKTSSEARV